MERLQTWWVTALYMPIDGDSCMEIPGDCEVVKAADAQATIAALQAELERTKFEMASELELQVNAVVREREQLKAKLAQRTAELERVRGERDHAKKMEAVQKEVADNQTWHVQKLRTLIAALPKVEAVPMTDAGWTRERPTTAGWYWKWLGPITPDSYARGGWRG